MGITEIERVTPLLENTGDEVIADSEKAYVFFGNGMGDYVAYDTKSKEGIIWFKGKGPEYGKEFWDVVDEWISIGFEE